MNVYFQGETMRKRQKGFSLIELLIVVAIILIIAAIAIPNLIRARIAANQSSAASSLRTIASAAAMFSSTYQDGYPAANGLTILGPPAGGPGVAPSCATAGLIDSVLSGGQKSGYTFAWFQGSQPVTTVPNGCTAGDVDMFTATAQPIAPSTGTVSYCVDATNVVQQTLAPTVPAPGAATGCPGGLTPIGN
jgi:type IV pilus assembly protein PilA